MWKTFTSTVLISVAVLCLAVMVIIGILAGSPWRDTVSQTETWKNNMLLPFNTSVPLKISSSDIIAALSSNGSDVVFATFAKSFVSKNYSSAAESGVIFQETELGNTVKISVDEHVFQRRLSNGCPAGYYMNHIFENGSASCENVFSTTKTLQQKIDGSCHHGYFITAVYQNGSIVCRRRSVNNRRLRKSS